MTAELTGDHDLRRHDGKAAPRWEPDLQLIPAMLVTPRWPRKLTDYEAADRAWIVAGLTLAGWPAHEIVERIGGSIRLIRALRADAMTEACRLWQLDIKRLETELRQEHIAHTATQTALTQATRDVERKNTQIDQLIESLRATRSSTPTPSDQTTRRRRRKRRNRHHPSTRRRKRHH
ncbi:hypothetical protein [Mycolicibacterium canariasense]|nr:hypothetical protein [Mycolicibacterium canariasense]MCV7207042.1 hypothetical protein [Mycolicibacterium canariasense]